MAEPQGPAMIEALGLSKYYGDFAAIEDVTFQIPQGQVHGAVAVEDDTVVIEVKPGPYRPNEFMDWAPPEGEPSARALVEWMERAAIGASFRAA